LISEALKALLKRRINIFSGCSYKTTLEKKVHFLSHKNFTRPFQLTLTRGRLWGVTWLGGRNSKATWQLFKGLMWPLFICCAKRCPCTVLSNSSSSSAYQILCWKQHWKSFIKHFVGVQPLGRFCDAHVVGL
jgi:hypothetical protein